jgi:hypothetical protein
MGDWATAQLGWICGCFLVIPREPAFGILEQLRGVLLKGRQVVKRIDAVNRAGVNEAHEQVPDVSPVLSLEEEAALPM